MSAAIRALRPRLIGDPKSGFDATPARAKQALLAEYIRQNWTQTFEGIIRTGNRLIEGRFRKVDYDRFMLPFSYSWGKKLIKIAKSPRILDPVNRKVLPDKADALHQIALLTDRLFQLGVSEGVINSQCLVIDIKQFRQSFVDLGQPKRRRMTVVYECSPVRDEGAREALDSFVAAVQRLAEARFPAISIRGPRKMKELVPTG
jgi:hypothetical protein